GCRGGCGGAAVREGGDPAGECAGVAAMQAASRRLREASDAGDSPESADAPSRLLAGDRLVLEAEKIKEIDLAIAVAIRPRLILLEQELEAEEVEEGQFGVTIAVGVALAVPPLCGADVHDDLDAALDAGVRHG